MNCEVIDADGHVFEDYADIRSFYEGPLSGRIGSGRLLPDDHFHIWTDAPPQQAQGPRVIGTADEWLDFLDKTGVSETVIFPSGGLAIGMVVNVEYSVAYCQAYNNWLHARYLTQSPKLHAAGLLPIADVQESVAELQRGHSKLGMNVFMLPSTGQALGKHLGDRMYWPLYAEAERLDCVLAVHGGKHHGFGSLDSFSVYYPVHGLGHAFGPDPGDQAVAVDAHR